MKTLNRSFGSSYETEKISQALEKKRSNRTSGQLITLAVFTAIFTYELYGQILTRWLSLDYDVIWWTELVTTVVLCVHLVYGGIVTLYHKFFPTYIDVTAQEKRLLGILDGEPGFRLSPAKPQQNSPPGLKFSPSPIHAANKISPSHLHISPGNRSFSPPNFSLGLSAAAMDESIGHSSSMYSLAPNKPLSPASYEDGSYLRNRVSPSRSRLLKDDNITTIEGLNSYLSEEAAKERTEHIIQNDLQATPTTTFWNINRTVMDYVPMLKKFQYQVAPRTTQNTKTSSLDDDTEGSLSASLEIWNQRGVHSTELDLWMENLRYWLGQTVVQRLSKEVTNVNNELRKVGSEDSQIGDVSVSTLKNLAFSKGKFVPTLNNIIPYLEVTSNQEYLVQRIRRLGKDGCIADFDWNGGSSYNGKLWEDHLPTDSAIVMHLFCTYMDARIPANPKYPDGKTFTCQHFMATPEKPNFDMKKDYLCIYQTKVNPPHYKVIIGEEIIDLVKGRCNMFQAILLFLHHIEVKEHGMLGHVNLGLSGINVLWILNQRYR